jgi:fructose-1,6-bisphosphatase I
MKNIENNNPFTIRPKTLRQFILESEKDVLSGNKELSRLLQDISVAAKVVNREINKAGLVDILGQSGNSNIHGEEVKKLDEFAHDEFIATLKSGGECCVIASEECEQVIPVYQEYADARYVVLIDPVDGSSNIDVNVSIGTIFSIYKRVSVNGPGTERDCLQKGVDQVAAGYIIYGTSTMFVFTTGNGVNGFTLDLSVGEFYLSHPNMKIPAIGKFYSINEGNYQQFEEGIQKFINYCQEEISGSDSPYISRHIGSMVADFHRNLIKGGVFIYPSTQQHPKGKLRLMYECNPMAFLVEQAGGKASDGRNRTLEIESNAIHQLTPLIIGSADMVELVERFMQEYSASPVLVKK